MFKQALFVSIFVNFIIGTVATAQMQCVQLFDGNYNLTKKSYRLGNGWKSIKVTVERMGSIDGPIERIRIQNLSQDRLGFTNDYSFERNLGHLDPAKSEFNLLTNVTQSNFEVQDRAIRLESDGFQFILLIQSGKVTSLTAVVKSAQMALPEFSSLDYP
jgi:hypothetical protein